MNSGFNQLHCFFHVSPVQMFMVFISVERNRMDLFHTKCEITYCLKIDATKKTHNFFLNIICIGLQLQNYVCFHGRRNRCLKTERNMFKSNQNVSFLLNG